MGAILNIMIGSKKHSANPKEQIEKKLTIVQKQKRPLQLSKEPFKQQQQPILRVHFYN